MFKNDCNYWEEGGFVQIKKLEEECVAFHKVKFKMLKKGDVIVKITKKLAAVAVSTLMMFSITGMNVSAASTTQDGLEVTLVLRMTEPNGNIHDIAVYNYAF